MKDNANNGLRILIVDDEKSIRKFLSVSLISYGYNVSEAINGREGIKAIRNFRPDVIILDLGLPDMDGIEVIEEIREFSRIPTVSAFCTAGFGLFSDSFTSYQGSVALNLIIIVISIAGGIGFFVLYDIITLFQKSLRHQNPRRLSVHSKFVLMLSAILMAIGTLVIFVSERGLHSFLFGERLLTSAFQSISASTTTGFNTIDIGVMSSTSLFTIILLMFIGASPGGTGGGIKTTSFGIMLLFCFSLLTGKEDVNLFKRRILYQTINKVFAISFIAVLWVAVSTAILTYTEKAPFHEVFFEMVSAFGTVGLSTGITPTLSIAGKILISVTMLIGRIGPLAIGFSLVGKPKKVFFKYAEAELLVG